MPRFDGRGPLGMGPGTGWGMGPCAWPTGRQGAGMGWRRGGGGRGQGFGWRGFYDYYPNPAPTKKEEKEILSEEAALLEEELKAIKARLSELKG